MYTLLILLLAALGSADNIVETAQKSPLLSDLVKILTRPELAPILKTLSSPGNFTVFAPTNKAFSRLSWTENPTCGCRYGQFGHFCLTKFRTFSRTSARYCSRLSGSCYRNRYCKPMSQVEDFDADFITETLLYHVLDPSLGAVASGDLQGYQNVPTLMVDEQYVNRNEDAQVLNVFKRHHNVSVNFGIPGDRRATANVVIADIQCSNGVVHVIDKVLTFPPDVPSIANAAHLSILNQAIVKAGLVQALINTPSTTVFAPTNTAFQAVQWQNLTVDTLKAVLLYHVVPAVAFSTDLGENQDLPTLLTQTVNVKASGGQVTINDAIKVVTPNVITKSGVVHVVDQVILPPAMSL